MSKEQKEFFYNVLKNEQKVYSSLVKKVFFDALSSAYPLFSKEVSKKKFEKIVCKFMQHGAKNVKMWKMPNEFRLFVKKKKLFREIAYVDDLLWFEWSEVKLMMKNYKTQLVQEFSYKNEYKLSKSCVIKKLKYRVFEKGNFTKKGKFYLLAYYNMSEYRVLYVEISQVMYLFLKNLKKNGMKYSIKKIAKMSEQKKKEVKEFLENTLKELLIKGVIKI